MCDRASHVVFCFCAFLRSTGALIVWPLFAFLQLSILWQYCAAAAADLVTLQRSVSLSAAHLKHVRASLPSGVGFATRCAGGVVFQVLGSALASLCIWLPTTIVLSILSATDSASDVGQVGSFLRCDMAACTCLFPVPATTVQLGQLLTLLLHQ